MNNILITGSSGFIGTYFVNNYKKYYNIKTFSFLKNNISILDVNDIDVVFHLSALVHQMGGATAKEYERINVMQTIELAKKAKSAGVKQFVFMSTIKVCGEETKEKYTENSICNPSDEYGKSKLKAEKELQKLSDENFKVSIIRTPIVYGDGVKANIKSLIKLVNKISILPFGKIKNRRSMVYIGNLCHMVNQVIKQNQPGIFLASDDKPLSTTRLIELMAMGLNKKIFLIKIPLFETILKSFKKSYYKRLYGDLEIDNTLTRNKLNLKNPYTIEEGVGNMVKGFNK